MGSFMENAASKIGQHLESHSFSIVKSLYYFDILSNEPHKTKNVEENCML